MTRPAYDNLGMRPMREPNPYSAPDARVEDLPEPVDRRFRWKAVLIGAATDLAGSTVAGIVLVVVFALLVAPGAGGVEDKVDRLAQSWPFLMASMILGGGCTVLGGYVAGRIARHSFLKHALAAGVLSLAVGIALLPRRRRTLLRADRVSWLWTASPAGVAGWLARLAQSIAPPGQLDGQAPLADSLALQAQAHY